MKKSIVFSLVSVTGLFLLLGVVSLTSKVYGESISSQVYKCVDPLSPSVVDINAMREIVKLYDLKRVQVSTNSQVNALTQSLSSK